MSDRLRIAMAQLNLCVGDVEGNLAQILGAAQQARGELGADLIVFPELSLSGYPPEDLLFRRGLHDSVQAALATLQAQVRGIDILVGHPQREGSAIYNAATWMRDGQRLGTYYKHCLPNYSVFDEKRYFTRGRTPLVIAVKGVRVGVTICEDAWRPEPMRAAVDAGAQLLVNINASPYHLNKHLERLRTLGQRATENRVPIVYANLVGGQDELVFDGESFVVDAQGEVAQRAPAFQAGLFAVDVALPGVTPVRGAFAPVMSEAESIYRALMLGVRDYVNKNRFPGAVLGLSGGIDSALTLAVAADALGPDRVEVLMMPSRYTAPMSIEDAKRQADAMGVRCSVIPIEPMFDAFLQGLAEEFRGLQSDVTEENLQARIRGMLLMAVSNKTGKIVLTTGNKSEMAVGYATLYGDMAGGFAVIKDLFKTQVYEVAHYRNALSPVIPQRVFVRPPSAELRPDQRDTDSLPPYDVLDVVLKDYIENDRSPEDIVGAGYDADMVRRIAAMVVRNEYKRRQAPPGIRISPRAFGRDWRYPITVCKRGKG